MAHRHEEKRLTLSEAKAREERLNTGITVERPGTSGVMLRGNVVERTRHPSAHQSG